MHLRCRHMSTWHFTRFTYAMRASILQLVQMPNLLARFQGAYSHPVLHWKHAWRNHGCSSKPASKPLLVLLLHLLQLLLRHGECWQAVPVSTVTYHKSILKKQRQTARACPFKLSNQSEMDQVEWGELYLHAYRCRTSMVRPK